METFQRMHGLDAEALRIIYRKFREADKVGAAMTACGCVCAEVPGHGNTGVMEMKEASVHRGAMRCVLTRH